MTIATTRTASFGQIHVLFLKFHNRVLADIKRNNDLGDSATPFEARTEAGALALSVDRAQRVPHPHRRVSRPCKVLDATDRNHVGAGYMPVEFSGAAHRFGHSQIRPGLWHQSRDARRRYFPADPFAPLLKPTDPAPTPPARPRPASGGPLPAFLAISWDRFFGRTAARSKLIDIKLSASLPQPAELGRERVRHRLQAARIAASPHHGTRTRRFRWRAPDPADNAEVAPLRQKSCARWRLATCSAASISGCRRAGDHR